jgi:biopolymer transport protein ExbD
MGATLGTGSKRGDVNIELNIVPFIDLMSCLTAFLLVTAVWVNISSVENDPAGRGKGDIAGEEHPKLSVLIDHDGITVQAYPSGEARQIASHDWARLEDALREFKTVGELPQIEVAAASTSAHPIAYQEMIAAMDTAVKAGYPHVGITDPASLSAR